MTVLSAMEHEPDHVEVQVIDKDGSNSFDGGDDNIGDGGGSNGLMSHHHHQVQQESPARHHHLPMWVQDAIKAQSWGTELTTLEEVPEWQEDGGTYRTKHGWHGRDLIHDQHAPVRILQYFVQYGCGTLRQGGDNTQEDKSNKNNNNNDLHPNVVLTRGGCGTTLTGVVHFTKRAESHMGYCHGGAMTSVLDDVIGWVAFLVTGECRPWSGYTVQINCSLKRPIPVDAILMVQAIITHVERRKISVEAKIVDPNADYGVVHAIGTGLVVLNKGVLPHS